MANDDLILVLDDQTDLIISFDDGTDLVLVDDVPYAEHFPEYEGSYVVVPILYDDQVLETTDKVLRDDVTVKAIPVTQTTNPYNGYTVVIG